MSDKQYVHGYTVRESVRLTDQANTLANLLHTGTAYLRGESVLESGCGVGSQTVTLASNSPDANFTCIDLSEESLRLAAQKTEALGIRNIRFQKADIFSLPFPDESFDHIFVCFVLEHLSDPLRALLCLKKVLKQGGSITVIEGDHGSAYYSPRSEEAQKTIQCQIDLQSALNGNSLIGREVYPLLQKANFRSINVQPKTVYVDGATPSLAEGFTKNTFTAMIEGVKMQALSAEMIDAQTWDKGIRDLYRTAQPDGVFCYTFFKGIAYK